MEEKTLSKKYIKESSAVEPSPCQRVYSYRARIETRSSE